MDTHGKHLWLETTDEKGQTVLAPIYWRVNFFSPPSSHTFTRFSKRFRHSEWQVMETQRGSLSLIHKESAVEIHRYSRGYWKSFEIIALLDGKVKPLEEGKLVFRFQKDIK